MASPAVNLSRDSRPRPTPAQSKSAQEREKEFSEAVERVYRKYGSNLAAFLRDVLKEKELVKKA